MYTSIPSVHLSHFASRLRQSCLISFVCASVHSYIHCPSCLVDLENFLLAQTPVAFQHRDSVSLVLCVHLSIHTYIVRPSVMSGGPREFQRSTRTNTSHFGIETPSVLSHLVCVCICPFVHPSSVRLSRLVDPENFRLAQTPLAFRHRDSVSLVSSRLCVHLSIRTSIVSLPLELCSSVCQTLFVCSFVQSIMMIRYAHENYGE